MVRIIANELHMEIIILDWRIFDDSTVTRAQPSRVQNDDAYLLFYKQRGPVTRNLLTKYQNNG